MAPHTITAVISTRSPKQEGQNLPSSTTTTEPSSSHSSPPIPRQGSSSTSSMFMAAAAPFQAAVGSWGPSQPCITILPWISITPPTRSNSPSLHTSCSSSSSPPSATPRISVVPLLSVPPSSAPRALLREYFLRNPSIIPEEERKSRGRTRSLSRGRPKYEGCARRPKPREEGRSASVPPHCFCDTPPPDDKMPRCYGSFMVAYYATRSAFEIARVEEWRVREDIKLKHRALNHVESDLRDLWRRDNTDSRTYAKKLATRLDIWTQMEELDLELECAMERIAMAGARLEEMNARRRRIYHVIKGRYVHRFFLGYLDRVLQQRWRKGDSSAAVQMREEAERYEKWYKKTFKRLVYFLNIEEHEIVLSKEEMDAFGFPEVDRDRTVVWPGLQADGSWVSPCPSSKPCRRRRGRKM